MAEWPLKVELYNDGSNSFGVGTRALSKVDS